MKELEAIHLYDKKRASTKLEKVYSSPESVDPERGFGYGRTVTAYLEAL